MSSDKKILAITLEGTRKMQAIALYTVDDSRLIILEMNDIIGDPDEWMEAMRKDIAEKTQGGWVVMVEDRTHSFPAEAVSFNFDALCEDGRTYLQCCLDWYFDMQARGQIILEQHMERYNIRLDSQLIDAKHDDKGRIVYNVNWKECTGGHKALLMCVGGAVLEEPISARWIQAMAAARGGRRRAQIVTPLSAFIAAMGKADTARHYNFESRHEAVEATKTRWREHE